MAGFWHHTSRTGVGSRNQQELWNWTLCTHVRRGGTKRLKRWLCGLPWPTGEASVFGIILPSRWRTETDLSSYFQSASTPAPLSPLPWTAVHKRRRELQDLESNKLQPEDAVRQFPAAWLARLDYCAWGLLGVFLLRWMLVSFKRSYERHQSCHCSNAGTSHESYSCTSALLFSHQTLRHLGPVLWWQ